MGKQKRNQRKPTRAEREAEAAERRSDAARRGWETRRRHEAEAAERRSDAARRGWETRRRNEAEAAVDKARRSEAAKKGARRHKRREKAGKRAGEATGIFDLRDYFLSALSPKARLRADLPFFSFNDNFSRFSFPGFKVAGDLFFNPELTGGSFALWRVESLFSFTLSGLTKDGYSRGTFRLLAGPGFEEGDEEPEAEE